MVSLDTIPLIIDNAPVKVDNPTIITNTSTYTNAEYVKYVSAKPAHATAAAESSFLAFQTWSKSLPRTRREILQKTAALIRKNTAELIRVQMEETNCPEMWAAFNINIAALHLEETAGRITSALQGDIPVIQTPGQSAFVYKRPIGPVLSIPPWNAALFLATRAIDTPLAVGCTVVLKASELSPRTHHFLARLFHEAGVPAGVLNVIQASREDAAAVTETLISHPHIRKIEFIGSAGVGRHIGTMAGKYLKPTLMELGGKSAALVLEDADLELAAEGCVHGAYMHNGQVCFSTERIIVKETVLEKFLPILKKTAANYPVFGAITPKGSNNTIRLLEDAKTKGAEFLYGEIKLLAPNKIHPVVLTGVDESMEIYDEESFGPVLAVYSVKSDEEAIKLANSSKYGLSAGVYSRDVAKAMDIAGQLEVGQTHINFPLGNGTEEATFSIGLGKSSGWGKQNSNYGLDEFTVLRSILVTKPEEFKAGLAAAAAAARSG